MRGKALSAPWKWSTVSQLVASGKSGSESLSEFSDFECFFFFFFFFFFLCLLCRSASECVTKRSEYC